MEGLKLDIMVDGRFYTQIQMPLGMPIDYENDTPVFDFSETEAKRFIEEKCPSLKTRKYTYEVVTKKTKDLWKS